MIRSRSFPLLGGAALAVVPLCLALAQSAPPPPPQTRSVPDEQPAIFRTGANLVLVDVVVTGNGKPLQGLTQSDFRLSEDGQPQNISVFEEHRATDALQASATETLPPHTWSDAPHYAITSAANVLLLDALNTPLSDQVYIRRRMLQYLHSIPPGTRVAIFTLGSHLRMVQGFTTDSSIVEKALTELRSRPEKSPVLDPRYDQEMVMLAWLADAQGTSAQAVAAMNQFASDTASFESDLRVDMTMDALQQLARWLGTVPGRKNLIWYTGAVPITIAPDANQTDPTSNMRDYAPKLQTLAELMELARVAVYPVDARGLLNAPTTEAESDQMNPAILTEPAKGGTIAVPIPTVSDMVAQTNDRYLQSNFAEHSTMDQIANETGGKAFYNTNAVGDALVKSIANGANYYTLGYVPANKNYNGAYRKIDIELPEGHAQLQYRHGYYADDPSQTAKLMPGRLTPLIAAMQHGVLPESQVLFHVRVVSAGDPSVEGVKLSPEPAGNLAKNLSPPLHRYVCDYVVDPRAFDPATLPDGRIQRKIEITQVAYDADGIRINYTDQGFATAMPPAQEKQGIHLHQEIDLPAGDFFLRIGVRDMSSGRIGAIEIPLQVAKTRQTASTAE